MKKLIYLVYAIFITLMVVTFYVASGVYDGLVEDHYYIKAKHFFSRKAEEEKKEFSISIAPGRVNSGRNRMRVTLSLDREPLTGAMVIFYTGLISGTEHDGIFIMQETSPGRYETEYSIPSKGRWIFRVEIQSKDLNTERQWFVDVI